jgi:hypothetical protein
MTVAEQTIPQWALPGTSFYEHYERSGAVNNRLWHVRAIVDGAAVCRYWRRGKQRWQYEVLDWTWFHVLNGRLEW